MNTEYALEAIKTMLTTYLPAELIAIQVEAGSLTVTPVPAEYKIGEHDTDILTLYPSILIWSPYSRKQKDEPGYQEREIWIRVLSWIISNDMEDLHRFISRYSDGVGRVLRDENKWASGLHNPVIEDSNNTDLYQSDVGYAQGCLLEMTVDYIMV